MIRLFYSVVRFGVMLLSLFSQGRVLQKERVQSILVLEMTRLGDLVCILPLFRSLKDHFQGAFLTVAIRAEHQSLFLVVPWVDEVIAIPSSGVVDFVKSVRKIRQRAYDLVISASPSVRHAVLALLSKAKYKFGYLDYSRAKVVHLQSHRVRSLGFVMSDSTNHSIRNINERADALCKALGLRVPDRSPTLGYLRASPTPPVKLNGANGLRDNAPYIIVHPFAGWSYRTWPLDNFRELVHRILGYFSGYILIVCAESDRSRIQPLVQEFDRHPRVVFGIGLPLNDLAVILARACLFIGNDSGPLHLAAGVGTPLVGLFGPAPPELTGRVLDTSSFVYKKVECSPCNQDDCVRKWSPCMTRISVDEVFERVKQSGVLEYEFSVRPMACHRTV